MKFIFQERHENFSYSKSWLNHGGKWNFISVQTPQICAIPMEMQTKKNVRWNALTRIMMTGNFSNDTHFNSPYNKSGFRTTILWLYDVIMHAWRMSHEASFTSRVNMIILMLRIGTIYPNVSSDFDIADCPAFWRNRTVKINLMNLKDGDYPKNLKKKRCHCDWSWFICWNRPHSAYLPLYP